MINRKTSHKNRRKNTGSIRLLPYGVAFLSVTLALGLTQLLLPWIYPTTTPIFFVAVMVSAWYGGWNAGLLATILSTLAINYFFIEPINSFEIANIGTIARLSAFLIAAGLISSLNQSRSNALKKSQEALETLQETIEREQEAKEQLEKVLSITNDGVYVLDRNWQFTYVNERYCEMIDMERSELLGQNIWELFPAAVGTEADLKFRLAIREQTPIQFDYLYAPWNCWHDHRIYPSPSGLTVFLADISERKQAELMLVEQKQLLEMIASGRPLDDCLSALCDSVSKLNPGTRACFLLTDAQCKTFPRSITPDLPASFGEGLKDAPINDLCIGTCGEAVYRGQPISCTDIANDPRWSLEWRDLCLAHGILACHSKPVIGIDQRPKGSLMLCFDEARMPTEWEYELAEFGSQVASIAFERDRSLHALRESEEQFRVLANCAPSLIWVNGIDGGCEFVNQAYLDFFGKALEEVQGFGWRPYLHPDDEARYVSAYLEAFQERKPFRAQVRAMQADGQYRWIDSYGLPRFSVSGNFLGYVGISPDITELKEAETALVKSQQRLQSIIDAIPHAVWVLGADGQFHSSNQQWLNYYGISFAEATTTAWSQVHPDDLETVQQQWKRAMETRTPYEAEFRWRFADGSQRWYLCRAEPILDESGQVVEWLGTNTDITNIKQIEADLQKSQRFTQQVAETLPGLLYVYDLSEQRNVYINRQSLELLGYTPEQIHAMGSEITPQMVHPEDLPRAIAYQAALSKASEGAVLELEYRVQHTNGEWLWLLSRSTVFSRTPEGKVQQILGVAINITERKQIEAALQQSNDRFYAAMRAVEGIVFEWNIQTQNVYRSERLFELIGVHAEDAPPTQEWWADRVHPDDLKRIEAAFPTVIANSDRYEGEYRVRHEAGYWVDVWERGYLQRNLQGELIGVVGFTTDISERKRAEEALRESEERFRNLADNMSQLAWMTDATGWIFWYNKRWFEYTGTTLEEMQGWGWQKVHHPDHVERVVAHFRHSIETGESWEDTFPLRSPDGTYRWFLSRALPIKDNEGNIIRWFGTNTDITERREIQLQLQEQAQLLAKRNQELDQFVYVVSHDLKAPLRAIANLSQWLEDDLKEQLKEENQHQLELLRQRVYRLEAFIDGLLAYSRVGRTEVVEEKFNVGELLLEILDSLAPPVNFTIKVKPPMPLIVAKRLLLTQVFSNLISNAIKHHHRPDGQIIVSATEKGDGYEFIISDDGPGIAPEHHEKIFGIFQTLKAKDTKDSTGIGLSIVKKILETEGGAIVLESELGMGTTFRFTWPKQPQTLKDDTANLVQI
ncbi:PAS domain-containing protein [Aphanothece hegewaldii]|nr:PAS domain-containing protein [Aphanothece hegewaldii]